MAKRYVAFLRGISPLNAKMSDLKECFELAGFQNVVTVLASGNVVFDSKPLTEAKIEQKIERALKQHLQKAFLTIVRSKDDLTEILAENPFHSFQLKRGSKRVVTFLCVQPKLLPVLPIEHDGVRILKVENRMVFTAYEPHPKGAVFMRLLESKFGTRITTRTWETLEKIASK